MIETGIYEFEKTSGLIASPVVKLRFEAGALGRITYKV